METDGDVDSILSQQMSCMVTNDKEALVKQFQQVLGDPNLTPEMCAFFLEMSNWNLQSALGAYYDFGVTNSAQLRAMTSVNQLNLRFLKDITIGEGESIPPSTKFVKTWRVKNTGSIHWPEGTILCFMEGTRMTESDNFPIPCIGPNGEANISVEMESPRDMGIYQTRFQLNTTQRIPFGESIWCIITVDAMGIMDITQQMASAPLGHVTGHGNNPFLCRPTSTSPPVSDPTMDQSDMDLSEQLQRVLHSAPVDIMRQGGIPEGPPCTPCTPPDHSYTGHNFWNGQNRDHNM